jgi:hypothetical protein
MLRDSFAVNYFKRAERIGKDGCAYWKNVGLDVGQALKLRLGDVDAVL